MEYMEVKEQDLIENLNQSSKTSWKSYWTSSNLTREEINNILQIDDKALNRLLKRFSIQDYKYIKEDIIRACMGGKLIMQRCVLEELKNQYPDDCIILGNIIKRKNNLKEDDIAGAFSLMQDSLQAYFRWSVIRCEIRSNLKRGERAEIKDLLENIVKYLDEVHRDTRVLYKLGREDLRNNREE